MSSQVLRGLSLGLGGHFSPPKSLSSNSNPPMSFQQSMKRAKVELVACSATDQNQPAVSSQPAASDAVNRQEGTCDQQQVLLQQAVSPPRTRSGRRRLPLQDVPRQRLPVANTAVTPTTGMSPPSAQSNHSISENASAMFQHVSYPRGVLGGQEMQQLADRNYAAATAAVQAAASAGQPPQLQSLLVEPSWSRVLGPQFEQPYMKQLQGFLEQEWSSQAVYPPHECIFRAFNTVPFDQVRVVILGQDPYKNEGEAMGLSFSVPPGIKVPSSLNNIYKELAEDVGTTKPNNGCLKKWCSQGVLLLNAVLTLRAGESNSHAGKGWEHFTSAALAALAEQRSGVVFLLWGKYAQARCASLDMRKHHVLACAHPSGLSASRGFFGCHHFSQTNKLLVQSGQPPIDWQIDSV